jgi:GNAT superfamily N-acetyltransferase
VEYRRIGSGTTVRISPWRGDVSTAQVVTVGGPAPDEAMVLDLLQLLGRRGVTTVLTAALSPEYQCPFSAAGFTALEHLALMHRSLHPGDPAPPSRSSHRLRRIGRPRLADALDADAEAFSSFTPFWLFDGAAYTEACEATDLSRQRCVRSDGRITAYAITGRTSTNGFVQRLAVRPDHEGMGLGSALLVDALSWLALGGARDAWVNTQPDNDRARALYLRHGFEEKAGGLTVLRHVSAR